MKIGEFSKKHQVTVDTVRHYINEGLLTPLRENTQYSFSEIDDRVMESVLLLKSMNFKLEEMKAYLLFQSMYTNNTFSYLGSFRKEFEEKLEENKKEIERLKKMNELIEKQLAEYQDVDFTRGISLRMLPDLVCPECDENLELEASMISHNEIMEGKLACSKCGKTYYIRYGFLSDEPIGEFKRQAGVAEMLEHYLEQNDEQYILKIREIFQKVAELANDNANGVKNVLIDGVSAGFLNSALLRSLPEDIRLFVHAGENITMKVIQEDIFPKDTIFYTGSIENAPFKVPMDYVFLQDYDVDMHFEKRYEYYPHFRADVSVICFKTYIYGKEIPFVADEKVFLDDMKKRGLQKVTAYKTGKILLKKDSPDMTILDKEEDMETEYAIYSFKTLG